MKTIPLMMRSSSPIYHQFSAQNGGDVTPDSDCRVETQDWQQHKLGPKETSRRGSRCEKEQHGCLSSGQNEITLSMPSDNVTDRHPPFLSNPALTAEESNRRSHPATRNWRALLYFPFCYSFNVYLFSVTKPIFTTDLYLLWIIQVYSKSHNDYNQSDDRTVLIK